MRATFAEQEHVSTLMPGQNSSHGSRVAWVIRQITPAFTAQHTHMPRQNSSSSCGCQVVAYLDPSRSNPKSCKDNSDNNRLSACHELMSPVCNEAASSYLEATGY
jgi:hypothetical protein